MHNREWPTMVQLHRWKSSQAGFIKIKIMKKLTLATRFTEYQYSLICKELNLESIPKNLKLTLDSYAGLSTNENVYYDKIKNLKWVMSKFCDFRLIQKDFSIELDLIKIQIHQLEVSLPMLDGAMTEATSLSRQ
jgi:hypothetical protein